MEAFGVVEAEPQEHPKLRTVIGDDDPDGRR
jgi:hypothetical protein